MKYLVISIMLTMILSLSAKTREIDHMILGMKRTDQDIIMIMKLIDEVKEDTIRGGENSLYKIEKIITLLNHKSHYMYDQHRIQIKAAIERLMHMKLGIQEQLTLFHAYEDLYKTA